MSEQNRPANTSTPVVLPAKRKRGRPRKDINVAKRNEGTLQLQPNADGIRAVQQIEARPNDRSMVGKVVSGVIDGSFDAGYFLSVNIGNSGPPLRGVIFEPGRIMPISSNNDVAPHAKLYQRAELPMPASIPQNQGNGVVPQLEMQQPNVCRQVLPSKESCSASFAFVNQSASTTVPVVNVPVNNSSSSLVDTILRQQSPNFDYQNQSQSIPPAENLRMVEQDDMMQVYEVSVQSEGLIAHAGSAKHWMSESSIKPTANNVVAHKEIMDQVSRYQNQDTVYWPEPIAPVHNGHKFPGTDNFVAVEPESVAQETQGMDSEVKQNQLATNIELKDPCLDFNQSSLTTQGIDGEFQHRALVQNESQVGNLELHETPIVTQPPSVPLENQNPESELQTAELFDSQINDPNPQTQFLLQDHQAEESEIKQSDSIENQPTGPNQDLYQSPTLQKLQSVSTNPENRKAELEQSKLAHYDLENQNFGILRDFVAGNHHYLPPEVISDQPGEFMLEKQNSPKCNNEKATQLENNKSSPREKLISDPVDSNQQSSRAREEMPFDLELAAEEPPQPGGIPENVVLGSTSNPCGLSDTEPR